MNLSQKLAGTEIEIKRDDEARVHQLLGYLANTARMSRAVRLTSRIEVVRQLLAIFEAEHAAMRARERARRAAKKNREENAIVERRLRIWRASQDEALGIRHRAWIEPPGGA